MQSNNYFDITPSTTSGDLRSRYIKIVKGKIANKIYLHLLSRNDETEYFDLDILKTYKLDKAESNKILCWVEKELRAVSWKTKLGFGDTGLFIYSTDEPPTNCW